MRNPPLERAHLAASRRLTSTPPALYSKSNKDSFLGDEWVTPLVEDSLRFRETGKLHHLGVEREHGEMAWVETDQLEYGYPALHELVVNLHALAFELNLKEPGLRLSRPFQGEKKRGNKSRMLSSVGLACPNVTVFRTFGDGMKGVIWVGFSAAPEPPSGGGRGREPCRHNTTNTRSCAKGSYTKQTDSVRVSSP